MKKIQLSVFIFQTLKVLFKLSGINFTNLIKSFLTVFKEVLDLCKGCTFKRAQEKKSAILNGVSFWVKFILSLLTEKILHCVGFSPSKVKVCV